MGLMIGGTETPLIDGEKINLFHIALMDQLRNDVPDQYFINEYPCGAPVL